MDVSKIQEKLDQIKKNQTKTPKDSTERNSWTWKPAKGEQIIRLLPNPRQEDVPFVELFIYYRFGKTWLSPMCVNQPDPVIEYCNQLIDPSVRLPLDEWKALNEVKQALMPTQRIFAPILVRGAEADGPKYWGFANMIYEKILALIVDPEYGSIENLERGTDMTVEYIPSPDENDPKKAKTDIRPKRNTSIATADPAFLQKLASMPDIKSLFTVPTYEELQQALDAYLMGKASKSGRVEAVDNKGGYVPSAGSPAASATPLSTDGDSAKSEFDKIQSMFSDMMKNKK